MDLTMRLKCGGAPIAYSDSTRHTCGVLGKALAMSDVTVFGSRM